MRSDPERLVDRHRQRVEEEMRRRAAELVPLTQADVDAVRDGTLLYCEQIRQGTAPGQYSGAARAVQRLSSLSERFLKAGDIASVIRKKIA